MYKLAFIFLIALLGPSKKYRFVALGDSYTICEGAKKEEQWPLVLTQHLKEKGLDIELIANPSVTGYTTQNLIDTELPVFDKANASFVTLLIGVNDWVQRVDSTVFKRNLVYILDKVQKQLPDKSKVVLITIPDFGVTPTGAMYGGGRNISKGIAEFNGIISREAKKRKLPLVDIYPVTQKMSITEGHIAKDGLHPSAKEYAIWEQMILPVAHGLLK